MTKLTVRDVISGGSPKFDPLTLDTSEIKALSNAMPKDGNIDINNAEVLAVKYLRGSDICGELLAIATAHLSKTKHLKEVAYSRAFLKAKDDKSVKTDKLRAALADLDEDYIEAINRYNEALAFSKWVDSKYNTFIKAHYMCRDVLKRNMEHEAATSGDFGVKDKEEMW